MGNTRIEYDIVRSSRRTIGLEVRNGRLTVRAPLKASAGSVERVILDHAGWIERKLAENARRLEEAGNCGRFTDEELRKAKADAKRLLPERVSEHAAVMGVRYGKISVRTQGSRWGSCSSKGNLSFNCLLMFMPREVADSVIIHELCHISEMNHSKRFYELVHRYCPDYDRCDRWLKTEGKILMMRAGK